MTDLEQGAKIGKAWYPIVAGLVIFGFAFGAGWTMFNSRVSALESDNQKQDERISALATADSVSHPLAESVPLMKQDIAWLKANMIQLLVHFGIQPVIPKQ